MLLWLLIILAFIAQEPISTSAVMFEAYQKGYSVLGMTLLASVITLAEVVITYRPGEFLARRFGRTRTMAFLNRKLQSYASFAGTWGNRAALFVIVPQLFPLSGIFIPWLGISLSESLPYVFVGELLFWYGYAWLLVLGAKSLVHGSQLALYVAIAIIILTTIVPRMMSRKSLKKGNPETPLKNDASADARGTVVDDQGLPGSK